MKVEIIELTKTLTEKTACEFIGRLASVCTGKEPKNDAIAEKIGRMNLTEHLGTATRCWEFLPVRFAVIDTYPNFRGGLNSKLTIASLCELYNKDMFRAKEDYYLFKISVPKYVRDHVKTHVKLSHISSSARIGIDKEKLYEFPEIEITEHQLTSEFYTHYINEGEQDEIEIEYDFLEYEYDLISNKGRGFSKNFPADVFTELLKYYYNRKEITKRSLSDFEVVDMVIGGYFNEGWDNFIKVRTASCDSTFVCPNPGCEKPCIQKETRELALMIKKLIGGEKCLTN